MTITVLHDAADKLEELAEAEDRRGQNSSADGCRGMAYTLRSMGASITFQSRVKPWLQACFGHEIAADTVERNHRFLEEALELVQACGCTQSEAHQLVDYVFDRPTGEQAQEVGGVMVTLAALCLAQGLDMHDAGEVELARIWTEVEAIRAKQAAKPKHSPLPGPGTRVGAAHQDDLPALISELEHAAMGYAQDPSRHTERRLDAARDDVRAALSAQPTAERITPSQLAQHLADGGTAELTAQPAAGGAAVPSLPEHETPAMHDAVMAVLYASGGVMRSSTDALWRAYRGALLAAQPQQSPAPEKSDLALKYAEGFGKGHDAGWQAAEAHFRATSKPLGQIVALRRVRDGGISCLSRMMPRESDAAACAERWRNDYAGDLWRVEVLNVFAGPFVEPQPSPVAPNWQPITDADLGQAEARVMDQMPDPLFVDTQPGELGDQITVGVDRRGRTDGERP